MKKYIWLATILVVLLITSTIVIGNQYLRQKSKHNEDLAHEQDIVADFKNLYCKSIISEVQLGESRVSEKDFPEIRYIQSQINKLSKLTNENEVRQQLAFLYDLYDQKMILANEWEDAFNKFWNEHPGKCIMCDSFTGGVPLTESEISYFYAATGAYSTSQDTINESILVTSWSLLETSSEESICSDLSVDDRGIIELFYGY